MEKYNPSHIEPKWQKTWLDSKIYKAIENKKAETFFALVEFPYPSGDGLHTGHVRSYAAMDVICRKKRMQGVNVLYPIGWDAFGLPTENYAIKTGIHPSIVTKNNTDRFREQLQSMGFSFDWDREINTSDPKYYKWTQWIFLQLFKNGLAYKKKLFINWCPSCKIGLANEEVISGTCERCGTLVEKREKEQWMLAITKYADRLYKDLDDTEFLDRIKVSQRNWIGPSQGSELDFKLSTGQNLTVFTTRADTLYGVTYVVIAPDAQIVKDLIESCSNKEDVLAYIHATLNETEFERTAQDREKTGIVLEGITAYNPINQNQIPVWIADYVLADYGSGAVMAVPAHDTRDFAFAKKYNLPIIPVLAPIGDYRSYLMGADQITDSELLSIGVSTAGKTENNSRELSIPDDSLEKYEIMVTDKLSAGFWNEIVGSKTIFIFKDKNGKVQRFEQNSENEKQIFALCLEYSPSLKEEGITDLWGMLINNEWYSDLLIHTNYSTLINSGSHNGLSSEDAKVAITKASNGRLVTTHKLRDWVFSRQRYWGEPIPMINCSKCGWIPVPEEQLPVTLPEVENYKPTDSGESPLAAITEFVNTTCPACGALAKRETDTMPNWAGSSWYFLRYLDPHNDHALADPEILKYWGQVDWYNGGMEHTTLHLLYSRFWNKFLNDIKVVPYSEPYKKRTAQGMILGEGGIKMSKSKGNVVNPDTVIKEFGADALRVYEMFMGPFDQSIAWSTENISGSRRFLDRIWHLQDKLDTTISPSGEVDKLIHSLIQKVTEDIENMSFNTAIAAMMGAINTLDKLDKIPTYSYATLIILLAPFAPHITEEIWHNLGNSDSIHLQAWPVADPKKMVSTTSIIVIQVDGKVRDREEFETGLDEESVLDIAKALPNVSKYLEGKVIAKIIFIQNRLINIVTEEV